MLAFPERYASTEIRGHKCPIKHMLEKCSTNRRKVMLPYPAQSIGLTLENLYGGSLFLRSTLINDPGRVYKDYPSTPKHPVHHNYRPYPASITIFSQPWIVVRLLL